MQFYSSTFCFLLGSDNGPATYAADVVSGFPTIVVRSSKTGEINAYHNVCRHKAGPLEWSNTSGICSLNGLKCKVMTSYMTTIC